MSKSTPIQNLPPVNSNVQVEEIGHPPQQQPQLQPQQQPQFQPQQQPQFQPQMQQKPQFQQQQQPQFQQPMQPQFQQPMQQPAYSPEEIQDANYNIVIPPSHGGLKKANDSWFSSIYAYIKSNWKMVLLLFIMFYTVQTTTAQDVFCAFGRVLRFPNSVLFAGSQFLLAFVAVVTFIAVNVLS